MQRLLLTILVNCVGIAVATLIIPSIGYHHDLGTLILAGLILALVNFAFRPLVIVMALPAVILSLGVALLFINALMLWVTSKVVTGFHVGGFWATVGGALVMWLVNMALKPWTTGRHDRRRDEDRRTTYVRVMRGR
jgi:putative membrane protein